MSFNDREEKILNILYEKSFVRSSELAKMLYVSVSTLRRDLEKLEQKDLIVKEHGICKLSKKLRDERGSYELREQQYNTAKLKIAKEAIKRIKDGDNIMMDGSSTVYSMIHLMEDYKNLLIITNNAKVSFALGTMNIHNISTGGHMAKKTFSYVGQEAINAIKNFNADIMFFSCKGLTDEGYLTDTFKEENDVRREMMKYAKKRIALIDSSKVGKKYLYNLCHISEVDEVICEEKLPDYITKYME